MSDELANTGKILIYQNEKGDTRISYLAAFNYSTGKMDAQYHSVN